MPREPRTMPFLFRFTARSLLVGALALPVAVRGQSADSGDGFLFGRPHITVSFRGGVAQPSASSDVFAFSRQNLTLGRRDYLGGSYGLDLALRVAERLDVQVGVAFSSRTAGSEFRNWVDNNDKPIEQTTTFRRTPVTLGVKYYLTSPGRTLGRLAWIPSKIAPYVSAGGGVMSYDYRQSGDFVDFKTLDVFHSSLSSRANAAMIYGAAGVDYTLTPRLSVLTEARYDASRAKMNKDFQGFNRIDLSGLAVTAGLNVRF